MIISLVAAVAENGVIGKDGNLAVRISPDLKRFKAITMGKPLITGRKNFESIGRPLPGRQNIVITRQKDYAPEGVVVVHSLEEALKAAEPAEEVMVMGGADIFAMALPLADRFYLTEIHAEPEGDVFMPPWSPGNWREVLREDHPADGGTPAYSFVDLERIR
ncbi:MAG TPA: dihydrofolate reductase [Alphaproteobacteria bacterium]|nr:dihydrofolate reductase [Alphaproteobacteria bacterium]